MKRITKGNVIRYTDSSTDSSIDDLTQGKTYVVHENCDGRLVIVDDVGDERFVENFIPLRAQLVEEQSELEQLVAKANEGIDAIRQIHKHYAGQAEYEEQFKPQKWSDVHYTSDACGLGKYRVKPKPTFEPFTTSNGWKVELKGDRLHIGCKSFCAVGMKRALNDLTRFQHRMGSYQNISEREEFYGTRNGIQDDNNTLPWADADRILEALEKAGVK